MRLGVFRARLDVGHGLDGEIGRAALVADPERQLRRFILRADLGDDAVQAGAERDRRREAIRIELAVTRVLEHLLAVPEELERARGADPERHGARRAAALLRADPRRRERAHVLARAHELAEVEPAVRAGSRRRAPADRTLLALVGAVRLDGGEELIFRLEEAGEAALVLVVEGAERHEVADEAELGDDSLSAVEVAATAAGVRDEELGVDARGRRDRAVLGDRADALLDLAGIGAIPEAPELADGGVDLGAARRAELDQRAGELGAHRAEVGARVAVGEDGEDEDQAEQPRTAQKGAHRPGYPVPRPRGQGKRRTRRALSPKPPARPLDRPGRGGAPPCRSLGSSRGARRDRAGGCRARARGDGRHRSGRPAPATSGSRRAPPR